MENITVVKTVEIETVIDPNDIAKQLANSWNTEQANFINTFANELEKACGKGLESQICDLSTELNDSGIQLIEELFEFIKLNKQK